MSRSDTAVLSPPKHRRPPRTTPVHVPPPVEAPPAYGRPFWLAYTANVLLLAGIGILFRYADFVTLLGGTELHLGWIVGVGMVGSLFMRVVLGTWIDRYGARPLWLGSVALFIVTCFAHLTLTSSTGMVVYLLRIGYSCAVAGANGASMSFVSIRGPDRRMAELVGILGTAAFVGTVIGTSLGDLIVQSTPATQAEVVHMFVTAGMLGMLSMPFVWLATRREKRGGDCPNFRINENGTVPFAAASSLIPHPSSLRPPPSLLSLLRRYNPGFVLVIGVALGVGMELPRTFLRTYAASLGISRIGLFFLVYAVSAVITRFVARRWPERFGPRRIIFLGMTGMIIGVLLFLVVRSEWQLVIPAFVYGFSHAILFPSIVAAGSITFPKCHRGLATVLILAMWDLGLLIGSPTAGAVLSTSRSVGLPPYPTMFLTMAALLAVVGVWYAVTSRPVAVARDR